METDVSNQARRTVQEMERKTFQASTVCEAANVTALTDQWQELHKTKLEVKEKFNKTYMLNTFMRNLAAPREEWETLTGISDEQLSKAKALLRDVKHGVDEQKQQTMELSGIFEQKIAVYQQNLQTLQEKVQILENMNKELQNLKENLSVSGENGEDDLQKEVQAELAKYTEEIKKCRRDLLRVEHANAERQLQISQVQDDIHQVLVTLDEDEERMDARCLSRLQKSIADIEVLSGVTCKNIDDKTIVVEFPPTQKSLSQTSTEPSVQDDLVLKITLTFEENSMGSLRLSGVKSNFDSLEVSDLLQSGDSDSTSLPKLISCIKNRWLSHVPLLSEVNHLRTKFAIDWIQQENVLRVIVGKGGSVVCSLSITPGYPYQGHVTLTSVLGAADDVKVEDLQPPGDKRLKDWMQFLENVFGKP